MRVPDGATVMAEGSLVSSDVGGGERVVLSIDRGMYFGLDEVASHIWELIQSPARVEEIHASVLAEFDVTETRAIEDVDGFLGDLIDHGLARVVHVEDPGAR
jgi:hypothetical protein